MVIAIAALLALGGCGVDCLAGTMNCTSERRAGTLLALTLAAPLIAGDMLAEQAREARRGPSSPPAPPVQTRLPLTGPARASAGGLASGTLDQPVRSDGWACRPGNIVFEPVTDRIEGCILDADRRLGQAVITAGNGLFCGDNGCRVHVEPPRGQKLGGRGCSSGRIILIDADGGNPRPLFGRR